jgi:hypothetical protein
MICVAGKSALDRTSAERGRPWQNATNNGDVTPFSGLKAQVVLASCV